MGFIVGIMFHEQGGNGKQYNKISSYNMKSISAQQPENLSWQITKITEIYVQY
jgi:hypothetical protein